MFRRRRPSLMLDRETEARAVTIHYSDCLSSMTIRHVLSAVGALVAALAAPAAAHASCASGTLAEQAARASVIVTATALPGVTGRGGVGLLSPATFKVTRYEKGSGPGTIKVTTALSTLANGALGGEDLINPLPGQRWLLSGSFDSSGLFTTSVCAGSHRAVAPFSSPQLRTSSGRVVAQLRRSAYDPAAISGAAVALRPGRPLTLLTGVGAPVDHGQATLRQTVGLRAKVAGRWQPLDVRWSAGPEGQISAVRIKTVPARTTALQVLTPGGFFAVKLGTR